MFESLCHILWVNSKDLDPKSTFFECGNVAYQIEGNIDLINMQVKKKNNKNTPPPPSMPLDGDISKKINSGSGQVAYQTLGDCKLKSICLYTQWTTHMKSEVI